jgi:hypothetical protein
LKNSTIIPFFCQVYTAFTAVRFAKTVSDFIQADMAVMQGIAVGMSAPGLSLFGRTLIAAGQTTAKVVSGVLAGVGILFGIWDIVGGVQDINGSDHSTAYRKAADSIEDQTNTLKELLSKLAKEGK